MNKKSAPNCAAENGLPDTGSDADAEAIIFQPTHAQIILIAICRVEAIKRTATHHKFKHCHKLWVISLWHSTPANFVRNRNHQCYILRRVCRPSCSVRAFLCVCQYDLRRNPFRVLHFPIRTGPFEFIATLLVASNAAMPVKFVRAMQYSVICNVWRQILHAPYGHACCSLECSTSVLQYLFTFFKKFTLSAKWHSSSLFLFPFVSIASAMAFWRLSTAHKQNAL